MHKYDFQAFTDALATCNDDLGKVYIGLQDLAQQVVGHKLFTLMTVDRNTGEAARIYSNMPDVYPIFGRKPPNESHWRTQVIENHQTFVANDIDTIATVFDDHELIRSLGCESVINVPVIIAGQVIGTINCLAEAGHYSDERVTASQALILPGAACFLCQLSQPLSGGH
jgi:GAF domain-containing protein